MDKRMNLFKDSKGYLQKGFELCIQKQNEIEGRLMVNLPSIPAMYLNISDKAKGDAIEIYQANLQPYISYVETSNPTENYFEFKIKNPEIIYDVLKNLFVSIIFMYTAVESITNDLIPNEYSEPRKIDKKEHTVGKTWIEKKDKLSDKIKVLVPKIYKFNFELRNSKFWREFKDLESFRNELIHLKSDELHNGEHKLGPLLSMIFYKCIKCNIIESGEKF